MVIYTFYTKECVQKISQGHLCGYSVGVSASECVCELLTLKMALIFLWGNHCHVY